MPERALLEAINELKQVVAALTRVLEEDYPKRSEVEDRFVSRRTSWRRTQLIILFVVVSLVGSIFASVTTVSACFLGGDEHPRVCELMPGYSETQRKNEILITEFRELQEQSVLNEKRINKLENRKD